jgi:hypothetical protein
MTTDDRYVRFNPFADDRDVDIRCRTVKMVTTRKEQSCFSPSTGKQHKIPPGTRARFEAAIVDGEWGRFYVCVKCMDEWFAL